MVSDVGETVGKGSGGREVRQHAGDKENDPLPSEGTEDVVTVGSEEQQQTNTDTRGKALHLCWGQSQE